MRPDQLDAKINCISGTLLGFGTGPLAELRRMEPGTVGPAAYWKIAAQCIGPSDQTDEWMRIVRIMAILTPKGGRNPKSRVHGSHSLGGALCDGGDPTWVPDNPLNPRGVLSEDRLNRLTLASTTLRAEALERIARALARTRSPEIGIDCTEIARLILEPHDPEPMRKLAGDYFACLDRQARKSDSREEGTAQ